MNHRGGVLLSAYTAFYSFDRRTDDLLFYNWLNDSKSIPEAFRKAQASIREKYPDPFYWAGFVLVQ
ncbi:MAG: hypothetical protein MI974_17015 [Chitinophagales bacterium]|nr:hypothetical protein [Chitinophagales bacterium]